uniref:RING-type domain-containing protein n=1 Tax=Fusarium oxysporum (strain Fo5176) TaxID=660025 RepID=A0A0D2Y868_FUSOF
MYYRGPFFRMQTWSFHTGPLSARNAPFSSQFVEIQAAGSSRDWHEQQLAKRKDILSQFKSEDTCFSCIRRRPQYTLPCGHMICQVCVRIFSSTSITDPWLVEVKACPVCTAPTHDLTIRLVPDTSRLRVLSIDGGGIRGAAPLGFLKALEDEVGIPNFAIQRHFDVKFGTSSDCSFASHIGSHVGVTLTRARDGAGFIATNYNQAGCRPEILDYSHLPSGCGQQAVKWWEVLRAATSAPYYFDGKRVSGHGIYQDGGLAFNNPASIALREAVALTPDGAEPSILLSLGTGSSAPLRKYLSIVYETFPFRVGRALWHRTFAAPVNPYFSKVHQFLSP